MSFYNTCRILYRILGKYRYGLERMGLFTIQAKYNGTSMPFVYTSLVCPLFSRLLRCKSYKEKNLFNKIENALGDHSNAFSIYHFISSSIQYANRV